MYVNPFIAGIIFTIMVELIVVICFSFYIANKKK